MKKFMVMFMAVCTMFICGMTVNAEEVSAPAQTVVQTEDSAGIHGNIIDIVNDQQYSTGNKCKGKCDGKWDKCPKDCNCGDCPVCTDKFDGTCRCDDCPCCKGDKCTCDSKCDCPCCKGGKCTCDSKCDCPCCKEGKCTCGEEKADSVHGNIIDAVQGEPDTKCDCDKAKCDCNKQKCKSKTCKKGCKVKK